MFLEPFTWHKQSTGWGYLPTAHPGYRAFVKKERGFWNFLTLRKKVWQ